MRAKGSKHPTVCGDEKKIYDELGVWEDSVTCDLLKGHSEPHRAVLVWFYPDVPVTEGERGRA